jgi:hypothetical protein
MMEGRVWQRGASKGRKDSQNARQMQSSAYSSNQQQVYRDSAYEAFTSDPMMSAIQKSLIAETI